MPGGWDSFRQAIFADGPVAWYGFNELQGAVTAGGQNPQALCLDGSAAGNLNTPIQVHANNLAYGTAVTGNVGSLIQVNGPTQDPGGAALFPSTTTVAPQNVIANLSQVLSTLPAASLNTVASFTLQPTTAITVEAWHKPAVFTGSSVKQVLACFGQDNASLAAYNLFHSGSSTSNHVFGFAVNVAGTLKTATATAPTLTAGTTFHVVGTYDGTNVRIFVNGVLQGTTAATGAISYASVGAIGLVMGNDGSLSDANLQGTLDEVAIYNYALSATRIAYHFRQGSTFLPFVWNH